MCARDRKRKQNVYEREIERVHTNKLHLVKIFGIISALNRIKEKKSVFIKKLLLKFSHF